MAAEPVTANQVVLASVVAGGEPVAGELLRKVSTAEWSRLPGVAAAHLAAPAAYLGVRRSTCVPAPVLAEMQRRYDSALRHHLLTWSVLRQVTGVLGEAGVPHVALKGPVLAETVYPRPDLRQYADLDVLVPPARFGDALRALEAAGAGLIESNWELVLHLFKGELNVVMPQGIVVDLHWSLAYNDEIRRSFRWHDERFLDRARGVRVGDDVIRVPDPVDQLIHLCAHACLAGAHRLGWLQDIRFAVTRTPIDWPRFWERAARRDLTLPIALVLDRARRCFGAEIPAVPGRDPWRRLGAGLDRARPLWQWSGGSMSGHVFAASTRATPRASLQAFRHGLSVSAGEVAHDRAHPSRPRWLRDDPPAASNDMCRPVGGPETRRAFLRAVEHAGRAHNT